MSVRFRAIHEEDIDAIMKIEQEVFPEPWGRDVFEEMAALGGETLTPIGLLVLHVVLVDETVAGYAAWSCNEKYRLGHILNIAVAVEYQGRGIGKRILAYVMDQLRNLDCQECYLEVRESNARAIHLYESFGMKFIKRVPNYYSNEDALIYSMRL